MAEYNTQIIKVIHPVEDSQLQPAADALKSGKLVAFPTETVYGLGADALNPDAVTKIFKAKGRPSDNPLIVHVAGPEDVSKLIDGDSESAGLLFSIFAPGPLTLVLPKSKLVPDCITAGLNTVAIRIPAHETARRLIRLAAVPLAAPSANRSGRPSPTRAWHVSEDLDGLIPYIIDDGPCEYGLESTVLDLTGEQAVILRPGAVTAAMIRKETGIIVIETDEYHRSDLTPRSPGMKYRHYAPKARVWIAEGNTSEERAAAISRYLKDEEEILAHEKRFIGLFLCKQTRNMVNMENVEAVALKNYEMDIRERYNSENNAFYYVDYSETPDAYEAAGKLFSALRNFDRAGASLIIAESLPIDGIGDAYMNRLSKAAGGGELPGGLV